MINYDKLKSGVYNYNYDTNKYNFYNIIQKIYNINTPLEYIHTSTYQPFTKQVLFDTDTCTPYHKKYYNSPFYNEFVSAYNDFIIENIVPIFNEDIVIQKEPSFRISLPNNSALGKCTNDKDPEIIGMHCDADYNHPAEEINFMLTITGQGETNSCYIETQPNKGDFFPVKMEKGEFMSFYGNKCRHYNKLNITNKTRISFDFRVIPYSMYKENNSIAVHSKRKFSIGEYFTLIHI